MNDRARPQRAEDERWMRRALAIAAQGATLGEVPVGALVVADGVLLGEGFNAPISEHDPSAHAEIQALRAACRQQQNYRLSGATLYVTLEPCTMCAGALVHARISRLVYGTSEPKSGAVHSQARVLEQPFLNWRVGVTGGVLADECGAMMREWFARRRAST